MKEFEATLEFARKMDAEDPLRSFRQRFHIPKGDDGRDVIYLCGNSLGLQPDNVPVAVNEVLENWQKLGVEGHFKGEHPWMPYHEFLTENAAMLVGAKPEEVVVMNSLTVNLHLMMVSFYWPVPARRKVLIEYQAFPSDRYAVKSQVQYHSFDPDRDILELAPKSGESVLHQEDIELFLNGRGNEIALVMLGGVNYYTGQFFDIERITKLAHDKGCVVGFDLAHAAGNMPLKLHEWDVDFAVWCNYKYLNSGPGAVAGCFVHERHAQNTNLKRFAGWWGHDKETRFEMGPDFNPMPTAEGWQLSNPPILSLAAVRASYEVFAEAGMDRLREKSIKLTGYLEYLLDALMHEEDFHILTPRDPEARGCQLSINVTHNARQVYEGLQARGVVCDWREPNCIRVAPVPLYNTFEDVARFAEIFSEELNRAKLEKAS